MSKSSGLPGDQEDGQDAKVYHPQKIEQVEYDPKINRVLHTPSGDFLILRSGHAGGPGHYTFGNLKIGMIAYGGFSSTGGYNGPLSYRVRSLRKELGGDKPRLSRAEFDLVRIAEMFRAAIDVRVPNHGKEILVVDSRPKFPMPDALASDTER